MITIFSSHKRFVLLLLVFFLLATTYNFTLPVGESDHEASHFRYIRYIKENWRRPPADYVWPEVPTEDGCQQRSLEGIHSAEWQFVQPPFYYVLTALAFSWFHHDEVWWPANNPYTTLAGLRPGGGANALVHTQEESIFQHPTVLEVRLYRLFSTIIGVLGLIGVYLMGLMFWSGNKKMAVLFSAGVALVPMYIASSAVVNNDILMGALGIWSLYFFFKSVVDFRHVVRWNVLGLLFFLLSAMTKFTFLLLLPALVMSWLGIMWKLYRKRDRALIKRIGIIALVDALILGGIAWSFLDRASQSLTSRYLFLQDPFSVLAYYPTTGKERFLESLQQGIIFSFSSYWGLLGPDSISLPPWMLWILFTFTMLAIIGGVSILLRSQSGRLLKGGLVASAIIIITNWFLIFFIIKFGARGRYLLSLYPLISLWMVGGLSFFRFGRSVPVMSYLFLVVLLAIAVSVPWRILPDAYKPPPLLQTPPTKPGDQPIYARYGDLAELISLRVEPEDVRPGEILHVTLVWRALKETSSNYTIGVHVEDGRHQFLSGVMHFPANGRYATSLWRPGDIFEDSYQIPIPFHLENGIPSAGYVKITMYCPTSSGDHYLPVVNAQGHAVGDAVYSRPFRIGEPVQPASINPDDLLGNFGNELGLLAVQGVPNSMNEIDHALLSTTWLALRRPSRDYNLFIQIINEDNEVMWGKDLPLTGGYYPTHLWPPGERVVHKHPLEMPPLPSGTYRLILGVYDPSDGTPLILSTESDHFTPEGFLLREWTHHNDVHQQCTYENGEWQCSTYLPLLISAGGERHSGSVNQ